MNIDPFTLLIIFIFALAVLYLRSPSTKGARGERRVRKSIAAKLDDGEYRQFHDVTLPSPDGTTQVDHIVVSPYGVFVVETKNYKGWIFGDARSRQWTQTLYRRKHRFQNPLHQNYKHVKAVESFLGLKAGLVHSVVTFVGRSEFRTTLPPNVTDLRGLIPYIRSKQERVLREAQVDRMAQMLTDHIAGAGQSTRGRPQLKVAGSSPVCPRCGNEMVLRKARQGKNAGKRFWGCSRFPKCRAVKELA